MCVQQLSSVTGAFSQAATTIHLMWWGGTSASVLAIALTRKAVTSYVWSTKFIIEQNLSESC